MIIILQYIGIGSCGEIMWTVHTRGKYDFEYGFCSSLIDDDTPIDTAIYGFSDDIATNYMWTYVLSQRR